MSGRKRDARHDADRLSAESYYALLAALTVIKAQGQMIGRWARRTEVSDGAVVLGRLATIDRLVGQIIVALDAMPAAPAVGDDAEAASGSDAN